MSTKTIKPAQGLGDYLAMGAGRSLKKLAAKYADDPGMTGGSFQSLARWSRTKGWRAAAEAYDAEVAEQAGEKLVERSAITMAMLAEGFMEVADGSLAEMKRRLADDEGRGNISEAHLLNMALEATGKAAVIGGGVSDRTGSVTGEEDLSPMERRIQEFAAERAGKAKGNGKGTVH